MRDSHIHPYRMILNLHLPWSFKMVIWWRNHDACNSRWKSQTLSYPRKHIMGALLPQMGNDWIPRGLAIQPVTDLPDLPYQEDDDFNYWHWLLDRHFWHTRGDKGDAIATCHHTSAYNALWGVAERCMESLFGMLEATCLCEVCGCAVSPSEETNTTPTVSSLRPVQILMFSCCLVWSLFIPITMYHVN